MISHRVFRKCRFQRSNFCGALLRTVSIVVLCILFLITNTRVLPGLTLGKNCHCESQLKTTSQCCCINSTTTEKITKPKACCSAKKQTTSQSCCSNQNKCLSNSNTKTKNKNASSICGCSHSTKQGLSVVNQWDLNPPLTLNTANELFIPLNFINDLPIKRSFVPEIPPPQLIML